MVTLKDPSITVYAFCKILLSKLNDASAMLAYDVDENAPADDSTSGKNRYVLYESRGEQGLWIDSEVILIGQDQGTKYSCIYSLPLNS
jgi:hypothetical protein